MIRLRTGKVVSVLAGRPGVLELEVEVEGALDRAIAYPDLSGPVAEGDRVLLNTTAVRLGLGTGGVHFVVAVEGQQDLDPDPEGHVMKLRYTPLQAVVRTVEEQGSPHRDAVMGAASLEGLPVVWAPLHSMVGAVAAGARAASAERVAYVMTDGGALPAAFSRQTAAVRDAGLLAGVITTGQAFGGDLEAVNLFTGLLAARAVLGADVAVVADGPGKVGTETKYGATDVAGGMALNVAAILGGRPIAALRVNAADPAYRHHGLSPHSVTVLSEVALVPVHIAVPTLPDDQRAAVMDALVAAGLHERHQVVEVTGEPALDLLAEHGIMPESMGRTASEEPALFLAAGAAGVLAGRMSAEDRAWRP